MRLPSVLDEIVLDFLHPDETKEALLVLCIKDPSLQNWEEWKWNVKRQVIGCNKNRGVIEMEICIDGVSHSKTQPARVWADGTKNWYWKGKLHRYNDQPARVYPDGSSVWYVNAKLHRNPDNDLPAIIQSNGAQHWYVNGKQHRAGDQPAVICSSGKEWWKEGKRHRNNGLPARMMKNGNREVWENGELIRSYFVQVTLL